MVVGQPLEKEEGVQPGGDTEVATHGLCVMSACPGHSDPPLLTFQLPGAPNSFSILYPNYLSDSSVTLKHERQDNNVKSYSTNQPVTFSFLNKSGPWTRGVRTSENSRHPHTFTVRDFILFLSPPSFLSSLPPFSPSFLSFLIPPPSSPSFPSPSLLPPHPSFGRGHLIENQLPCYHNRSPFRT